MQYFHVFCIYRVKQPKKRIYMNKKNRWKVSGLLSGALALLGFAGCSDNEEYPMELYGTPSVSYRVVGTVTDGDGKPLKDIQVVVENPYANAHFDDEGKPIKTKYETGELTPDTVYTDKDGKFESHWTGALSDTKMVVGFEDIDGEANGGEFQLKRFTRNELEWKLLEEGSFFYAGKIEYSKSVKLKRKGE